MIFKIIIICFIIFLLITVMSTLFSKIHPLSWRSKSPIQLYRPEASKVLKACLKQVLVKAKIMLKKTRRPHSIHAGLPLDYAT